MAFSRRQKPGGGADDEPVAEVKADATPEVATKAAEPVKAPEPAPDLARPNDQAESWPESMPKPNVTAESFRARTSTMVPSDPGPIGKPPDMPVERTEKSAIGEVEDPTRMPSARDVPDGFPTDPAAPPGQVPPGDSRSFRRGQDFALVYRRGTQVISRFGVVGQRGQWRVVEYPTSTSASHSYAKECSRYVSEGFSDYRA